MAKTYLKNRYGKISVLLMVAIAVSLASQAQIATAGIVNLTGATNFESSPWDNGQNAVYRDCSKLADPEIFNVPNYLQGADYNYIEDLKFDQAIGHSGNALGGGLLRQHVFGYTVAGDETIYGSRNRTEFSNTYIVTPQQAARPAGSPVIVKNEIELDGSLLLKKNPDNNENFKCLNAKLEIEVVYDFDFWGQLDRTIPIPIFRGSANLIGLANGYAIHYTSGMIPWFSISEVEKGGDIYKISFDNVKIPYYTWTLAGREFTLRTIVKSTVNNAGYGTGAEVILGLDEPVLPDLQSPVASNIVPEPITVMMLGLGVIPMAIKRRRKRD